LSQIWGVGSRLSQQYRKHELHTAADLMAADPARIAELFGVVGRRLQQELQDESVLPLETTKELQKSLMSSRSFAKATSNVTDLERAVIYHCEHVAADLRAMNAVASYVSASVRPSRHGDFVLRNARAEATLQTPTNDTQDLVQALLPQLRQQFEADVPYKKAGVMVGGIRPAGEVQPDLFASAATTSRAELMTAIDTLTRRFGKDTIRFAGANRTAARGALSYSSGSQTTAWSAIPRVLAR
jgi:Nucleotidyltransferase/DNA polymerase involved in DNA repair